MIAGVSGRVSVLSWFHATITRETINTGPGTEDQGPKDPRTQRLHNKQSLVISSDAMSSPLKPNSSSSFTLTTGIYPTKVLELCIYEEAP